MPLCRQNNTEVEPEHFHRSFSSCYGSLSTRGPIVWKPGNVVSHYGSPWVLLWLLFCWWDIVVLFECFILLRLFFL